MWVRLAAVVVLVAACSASTAAATSSPLVWTILSAGVVGGFAQDGARIAWIDWTEGCARAVRIRDLRSGRTWALTSRRSMVCEDWYPASYQEQMALAGTRALWATFHSSLSSDHNDLFYGGIGRPDRRVASMHTPGGLEGDEGGGVGPVELAGDGPTLVYSDHSSTEEVYGYEIVHFADGTALRGSHGTRALAVDRSTIVSVRSLTPGCVCWGLGPGVAARDGTIAVVGQARAGGLRYFSDVYVMLPDGTGLRRVTRTPDLYRLVSFSADGRRLLVEALGAIIVIDVDRGSSRLVARGSDSTWTPAGRVAYSVSDGGTSSIMTVAESGGKPRVLLQGDRPAWSPDGRRLAFTRGWGPVAVFLANGDGSAARRITRGQYPPRLAWSPDGRWLAINYFFGAFVVRADGSGLRRVGSGAESVEVEWSPDSTRLALLAGQTLQLYQSGSGDLRPAASGVFGPVVWSPSSDSLLARSKDKSLVLVPLDGSQPRRGPTVGVLAWLRDGRLLTRPAGDEQGDLQTMSPEGADVRRVTAVVADASWRGVEVRNARTGAVTSRFAAAGAVAVALSGEHVAVLIREKERGETFVELRSRRGKLQRRISTAPGVSAISLSGHWLVYGSNRDVVVVDVRTGNRFSTVRAGGAVVGLSIDGRRVAWGEQRPGRDRIRAFLVPQ